MRRHETNEDAFGLDSPASPISPAVSAEENAAVEEFLKS